MLHIIKDLNDPLIDLIKDDPVRPAIPSSSRVHDHAEIFVLLNDNVPAAGVKTLRHFTLFGVTHQELVVN